MKKVGVRVLGWSLLLLLAEGATTSQPHHHSSKEREQDGAFSPRDHSHFHGGEHHSEFDHEAILGSIKEAEEFDHLPPEEAKKRLRILLDKMDLNNDKRVDRNELHAWILRSFHMLSQEESQEKLEEADVNEDGKVTWEEYVAETFGIDGSEEDNDVDSKDSEEEKKLMENDKALFQAADSNKDGNLDKDEFRAFSHPEESPDMLPVILKQTLVDKDSNGDGYIDFKEYVGERAKEHDKEWLLVEKDKFDHEHDKDRDGRLDPHEVLSWVVPSNTEIAEDEVDHLFASADENHDDYLSFDEIVDHHDVFVGSEATDFGDHLHNIHVFQDEL